MGSLNVQLHEYHCDTCKLSRNCCLNHSPNLEDMLAPPSILLHSNSLDHEDEKAAEASREKPRRSNSCISEGGQSCISSSFSSSGGGGGVGVVAAGGSGTILL